ncbi:nitrate regulatory gene2 protein [Senna tora]|uniref:Nitrate regulatory gene2 protein n=1 Tax=Senna tora TaxID=362788 RepID=A0A834WSI3_9FABA|nr:nitrate regulatory gene2 protein [Senna tora]
MGCGASKVDDLPLVTLCRERKEFLRAASEQRYALAAAHVAYFQSLKEIGGALRKFVDEELVISTASSSPSSPVLTLPSDEGKGKKPKLKGKNRNSSSSTSISHTAYDNSPDQIHIEDDGHIHIEESPERDEGGPSYAYPPPQDWSHSGVNTYAYYMKKSTSTGKSIVYEEPERYVATSGQWPDPSYGYQGPPPGGDYPYNLQPGPSTPAPPPAPPSPPAVSSWDFLNVFDTYDNGYPGFYQEHRYGIGSTTSSPDSKEVREREGIPELEDETEQEAVKDVLKEKKKLNEDRERVRDKDVGEGTSKAVPLESSSEGSSKTVPFHSSDSSLSAHEKEIKSSPDSDRIVSEEHVRKKGVSFEVDEAPATAMDGESSKLSSVTTLSAHGTRDLREVVEEIKDEFETASSYGKEVALLLEVGKPPYRSRGAAFKVIFSRILYMVAPSKLPSHPPSRPSIQLSSRAMKLAKAYCEEPAIDFKTAPGNLSSTLEKLYAWEKKLYKEVKDEERLRVDYEKQCKRLKILDDRGAESSKIDATEASIRKLHTKINICIRTVDAISSRIHKLRDEELQPQLSELIQGLTRMWKFMLKCHQKQFQAIMESKTRSLKMNTALQRDAGLKATLELEMELLNWCTQFNNWVKTQKSYVENLNEWLMRCLLREREETADGVVPFSPSRIGAPQVFIICNDWYQAMTRISERGVADAMHEFAQKLHELWERQDDEQRQRIKAEYLTKDFEKRLRTLRMDMGGLETEHEKVSENTTLSKGPSDSGVSPLDDLKVDLDSIRKRMHEERVRHKEAIKLVHDAASNSLVAGLVPIFKTLESFTSEVVTAHEQVRLQNTENS